DVTTLISDLTSTAYFRSDIFDDLGTGTTYGSQDLATNWNYDPSRVDTIAFNSDAVVAILAAQGGPLALGGAITSLQDYSYQFLFDYTGLGYGVQQIELL